jgi:tRNA threonylcarbamoyladenosine biosynthesis protein TsaB
MLVFALDTATLQGSFGFVEISDDASESEVIRFASLSAPAAPGHAETAIERMQQVLSSGGFTLKDIDLIVFGRGPGTFTGVRIGLSTVKGVALAGDARVIGISSLEALALSAQKSGLVVPLIDAKRKELFGAVYEVSYTGSGRPEARPVMTERVASSDNMIDAVKQHVGADRVYLTGNGIPPYEAALRSGLNAMVLSQDVWAPSPFWMARVGHRRFLEHGPDDLDSVEPVYLREPDARLPSVTQR